MLIELLEEYFQREEPHRERDYFYVSEVGKCPRQIFCTVKGFPRPPLDGQTARKLAVGEDAHRRIVQAMYGLGIVVAAEVPIPPGALFHGRADAIVSLAGKNYVVEIKTVHPYNFDQMAISPRRDHYLQLQLYLHYFQIPQGIILAENKASQELREFVVELDRPEVNRVLAEFEALRETIFLRGELPPLPDKSDWEFDQCKYCPFVDFCRENISQLPKPAAPLELPKEPPVLPEPYEARIIGLFDEP
ncbi:PD-(D/E)XK nuclease family protein [Candidatus Bipolaricaulota bacterium]|nr:PD-(D/E)XK nuclease family protein [Candidatus Bipolaricaulota bacterium]